MSAKTCIKAAAVLLFCYGMASAQVSSIAPRNWKSASPLVVCSELDQNFSETLRREILDTNTVRLIGQSVRLTEHGRTLFLVAPGPIEEEVWLYRLGAEWGEDCRRFSERLAAYLEARLDGHTRACLLAGLTNHPAISNSEDADLLIVSTNYPILPISWFQKAESGTRTNKAGKVISRFLTTTMVNGALHFHTNDIHIPQVDEVYRWISYNFVDGKIGWQYILSFKFDGTFEGIDASKFDAKELDPKFKATIREVDSKVEAEMKQNGRLGKIGSIHTFWLMKKEMLKAKGIDWHSPAELNQGRIYD